MCSYKYLTSSTQETKSNKHTTWRKKTRGSEETVSIVKRRVLGVSREGRHQNNGEKRLLCKGGLEQRCLDCPWRQSSQWIHQTPWWRQMEKPPQKSRWEKERRNVHCLAHCIWLCGFSELCLKIKSMVLINLCLIYAGLKRCGKSCRLRWLNYLRPDIKRGNISPDEEELIIRLHKLLGNR